jgi:hypothetical protein
LTAADGEDGLTCKIPVELDSDGKSQDASILKQAAVLGGIPKDPSVVAGKAGNSVLGVPEMPSWNGFN